MARTQVEGQRQRILITGGSGFIGTNLVEYYSQDGHSVANLDVASPRNPAHAEFWCEADLMDPRSLRRVLGDFSPTVIHHMAARTDLVGETIAAYSANTRGVENLIEAVQATPSVTRVIFASSRMVCRIGYQPRHEEDYCPPNAYGASKVESERIVRKAELASEWVIVRPTSIWGPWFDAPYRDFFLAIARGRYFHVGSRRVQKSFGYVGNTVFELDRLGSAPSHIVHGRTLYLADYRPLEVREWAEGISRVLDAPRIRSIPYAALKLVAIAGDVAARLGWTNVPLTSFRLDNLLTEMMHDLRPLEKVVGPLPYSLQDGIVETGCWLRAQGDI